MNRCLATILFFLISAQTGMASQIRWEHHLDDCLKDAQRNAIRVAERRGHDTQGLRVVEYAGRSMGRMTSATVENLYNTTFRFRVLRGNNEVESMTLTMEQSISRKTGRSTCRFLIAY
jgi:hypothetical protein